MFESLKKLFQSRVSQPEPGVEPYLPPPSPPPKKPRKPKPLPESPPSPPPVSAKDIATAAGEPWVEVISFDMDPHDVHTGNFTLDFNDKFVMNLMRAGYKMKDTDTDSEIVDRWFTDICRSIVLEHYEQQQADPSNRGSGDDNVRPPSVKRDLGGGRVEVS